MKAALVASRFLGPSLRTVGASGPWKQRSRMAHAPLARGLAWLLRGRPRPGPGAARSCMGAAAGPGRGLRLDEPGHPATEVSFVLQRSRRPLAPTPGVRVDSMRAAYGGSVNRLRTGERNAHCQWQNNQRTVWPVSCQVALESRLGQTAALSGTGPLGLPVHNHDSNQQRNANKRNS